jgi:glutamyl-tRNA(Gln) amidotransferase subunit E
VLPGAERMYPDTDLPPLAITPARVHRIRGALAEDPWQREARYRHAGIPEDTILPLLAPAPARLFRRLVEELRIDPTFAAVTLVREFKALRRAGLDPDQLREAEILRVFELVQHDRLSREGVREVLLSILEHPNDFAEDGSRVTSTLARLEIRPTSLDEVRDFLHVLLPQRPPARFRSRQQRHRYVMGELMREFVGRVPGAQLSRLLSEELGIAVTGDPAEVTA